MANASFELTATVSPLTFATQSQQQAATSTTAMVSPGNMQWHPGIAKAVLEYNKNTSTITRSYNITSVSDDATGTCTATFTTNFSAANYVVVGNCNATLAGTTQFWMNAPFSTYSTSQCSFYTVSSSTSLGVDCDYAELVFFGDQ